MPPWDAPQRLGDVLQDLVGRAGRGAQLADALPASVLDAREWALGLPIPPEVRELYATLGPETWADAAPDGEPQPVLLDPADAEWQDARYQPWPAHRGLPAGPADTWQSAAYFVFGASDYGEPLAVCHNPPGRPGGCVVMLGLATEVGPCVLGDSLAQWLRRYVDCGRYEWAVNGGMFDDIDPAVRGAFLRDHLRLNPGSDWALRKLAEDAEEAEPVEPVQPKPGWRFRLWDSIAKRFRRGRELDERTTVSVKGEQAAELLAGGGRVMPNLGDLCLFDLAGELDLATLAQWPGLRSVQILRCTLRNLGAFGRLPVLRRLSVSYCRWAAGERLVIPPAVEWLEANETPLDDLSAVRGHARLSLVYVPETRVTDLSPLRGLPSLEAVHIPGTGVTDLRPLHDVPRLKTVELTLARFTATQVGALRAARPGLAVENTLPGEWLDWGWSYHDSLDAPQADDWPFAEPGWTQALTDVAVARENRPVEFCRRDPDGTWIVLPGLSAGDAPGARVPLVELVARDPSFAELADLAPGWDATRAGPGAPWVRARGG